jgi:hypothetical protein
VSQRRDHGTDAILAYHDATKHSPISVRSRAQFLDWDNKPHPFKVYAGLDGAPLPDDVPSLGVPALDAIGVTTIGEPVPGPDLVSLARLLVVGAGVHHAQTFSGSEVIRFRNYASAGALYPVEVYVVCGDLPGLWQVCTSSTRRAAPSPAFARVTTAGTSSGRRPPSPQWLGLRPS